MQTFFLLPVVAVLAQANPDRFLPKDYLVEVEVVQGRVGKDTSDVKLKIIHVYSGPYGIKDVVFSLNNDAIGRAVGKLWFPMFQVPIEKLEKSIIFVRYNEEHVLEITPISSPDCRFFELPAREKISKSGYKRVVELAKVVESVARNRVEERPGLLREFALNKTYGVAAWAIDALVDDDSDATSRFLDGLVTRNDVNFLARFTLDRVLVKRVGKEWKDGKRRQDMFRQMAQSTDEAELLSLVHFLNTGSRTVQNPYGFSPDVAISLTTSMMKNYDLPRPVRTESFRATTMIAKREGLIEKAFDALVDRVKNDKNDYTRRYAAEEIGKLIDPSSEYGNKPSNLSFEQRDQIKQILKIEKDERVTWRLEEALEKARKNDKPLNDKDRDDIQSVTIHVRTARIINVESPATA
jgi:hypothetical protein